MRNVTPEEVKTSVLAKGITRVEHHSCGGCNYPTAYIIEGEKLYYDAGCDCTRYKNVSPRGWDDASEWINMQREDIWKSRIAEKFGIDLTEGVTS